MYLYLLIWLLPLFILANMVNLQLVIFEQGYKLLQLISKYLYTLNISHYLTKIAAKALRCLFIFCVCHILLHLMMFSYKLNTMYLDEEECRISNNVASTSF